MSLAWSPKNFGGVGNGIADDTAALQDAINAAAAAGGFVHVPPGSWLHTGLTVPEGVNIVCAPRAYLSINHASNDSLTFTGAPTYLPNLVIGARFVGNVTNTGSVIRPGANARVVLRDCSFNSPVDIALQGRFGRADAAGSKLAFVDCRCDVAGSLRAYEASSGGQIAVKGGRIKMPSSFATQLAYANIGSRIDLQDVDIDVTAHTTGAATIFTSDSASDASIVDCRIDATGSSGLVTGFAWSTAARVKALGNEWRGLLAAPYGAVRAAAGSDIELLPHGVATNTLNAYTIPNGYRSFAVHNTVAVSPTFTLPARNFAGQALDLTIYNDSGATWGFGIANYGLKATQPTLNTATGASARFVVMDPTNSGTLAWVQVGAWVQVAP